MIHLQINPSSGVPVYRQMMDQIKYYVAAGTLRPDDLLPSIRDVAKALAINPATVVKAYNELEHEGVVEMKQGRGAFVAAAPGTVSIAKQRKALEPLARQLAVEARQMGAAKELVLQLLRQEMESLDHE